MIPNDMKHQYARNVLAVEDLRRQEESWEEELEAIAPEEIEPAGSPEEAA